MSDTRRKFQQLVEQFEYLADVLDKSNNPEERRVLLQRMKILIEEFDAIVLADGFPLHSIRDQDGLHKLHKAWAKSIQLPILNDEEGD